MPAFWQAGPGPTWTLLLRPASALVAHLAAHRATAPGWRAPVPVICCGNATVGGAGKTIVALDLLRRLGTAGVRAHALLRGYGGSGSGARRIHPGDDPRLCGDEALLLAEVAPTWVGGDRAESARCAIADGAEALVLDDGLQNPSLRKTLSLLVVDGGFGFGNGRVLPAGPLREPVTAAAARCRAAVLIGTDATGAHRALPSSLPVLRARLKPGPEGAALAGRRVLAFAGIGRPEKFFATVRETGALLVAEKPFADHHRFSAPDLRRLAAEARALGAALVTTAKDAVRLPASMREEVHVLTVALAWEDEALPDRLLDAALNEARQGAG